MKRKIAFCLSFLFLLLVGGGSQVFAQQKAFSASELSQFDGVSGRKAYYAYEGKVYDVTGSKLWLEGQHFGLQAGQDLTGKMTDAPHNTEVFSGFEVVGTYTLTVSALPSSPVSEIDKPPTLEPAWYQRRLQIFGFSILGWTGIALGVLFVLTFGTCFAMPWGKLPLPWQGSRPGHDALDAVPRRMTWSSVHKHFVWWLVVIAIIHGVLGFLQMLGIFL